MYNDCLSVCPSVRQTLRDAGGLSQAPPGGTPAHFLLRAQRETHLRDMWHVASCKLYDVNYLFHEELVAKL